MQNTPFRLGPLALTTTLGTDLFNPPVLDGGVGLSFTKTYALIKHIHVANTSAAARDLSLFIGATGGDDAGTEVVGAREVAANDVWDYYPANMRLTSDEFLTGGADASGLVITITGEIGVLPS